VKISFWASDSPFAKQSIFIDERLGNQGWLLDIPPLCGLILSRTISFCKISEWELQVPVSESFTYCSSYWGPRIFPCVKTPLPINLTLIHSKIDDESMDRVITSSNEQKWTVFLS
jgi:hypothetical protein